MDDIMGRKAAEGHDLSSRGSSIVFRDQNHDARSIQYCNRLGCSTRLNSIKGTQIGSLEKAKYVKASFHSTSSKTITGNSSKSLSSNGSYRRSFQDRQKQTLQREKATAETSNGQGKIEDSECNSMQGFLEDLGVRSQATEDTKFSESHPTSVAIQTALPDSKDLELPNHEGSSMNTTESSGSCTIASSSKPYKHIKRQLGSGNQAISSRSSFRHSSYAFRNSGNAARPGSQVLGTEAQKSGIKTLSCTSVSDVLPSGCSSSDFSCDRRTDAIRKRPSVGESSAAKGKGESGPSTGRYLGSTHTGISDSDRSLPQQLMPQQTFIRTGNRPTSRDGAASVRTRRASTVDARTRVSEQGVGDILPVHEPIMIPHLQQNRVSIPETVPESSSRSFSMELPNVVLNSSEHPGSRSRVARSRMVSRPEGGSTHNSHSSSGDRDGYRQFNMDRIAEVIFLHLCNSNSLSYILVVHGY
ncbi:putative E3 ubiquitin-protein ligase RLIM-like [Cocos nucifera]|uniref:Putative E3 ubiquitin-protein ligase RLIM-like n=1 Tax=Cocos nucifera TaxID=13894 RepID=A0A8K0I0M2_COCNU|nr:putative E3 ubiquitin-protein ligase RLIM-like [Cocos nucifera]